MTQCILSILPLVPLSRCLSLDPAPVETGPLFPLVFLDLTVLYRHLCALPTLDGFSFQWMLQLISMQTTPYSSYSWWKLIFLWLRGLFVQHALFMPSSFCFVIAPSLLTSIHCLDARGLRAFFFRSQSDVLGLSYTDMVNCSVCRACVTIICQRHKTRSLFFHDVIALSTSFSALGLW